MKSLLTILLLLSFAGTYAQTFTDNLKSYQRINYTIDLRDEINCMFCLSSFTEANLQSKLRQLFSDNNIPATLVTTMQYPCLKVILNKPDYASKSDFNDHGGIDSHDAHDYMMAFSLVDLINGKKVIVYQLVYTKNMIDASNGDLANKLWESVNNFMNSFSSDWKATH